MQKKQCLDRAPERERRPSAVLLRPLAGAEGAAWVRRSSFIAPNQAADDSWPFMILARQ